jgi:hypothetical protein
MPSQDVLLVVILREVEAIEFQELCRHFCTVIRVGNPSRSFRCEITLPFVVPEQSAHVLRLAPGTERIVTLPKHFEHVAEGEYLWIEINFQRLGVVPEIVIRGVSRFTSGIPHARTNNSIETPELGVRAPESAKSKCRGLEFSRSGAVDRGNLSAGHLWIGHAGSVSDFGTPPHLGASVYAALMSCSTSLLL